MLLGLRELARTVEERIEAFVAENRPRWLYVFFSGGKDSAAVLAAAASCCRDMVVAVYNHVAGQTHAANVSAALEAARRLGLRVRRLAPRSGPDLSRLLAEQPPEPPEMLYILARSYSRGLDYWAELLRNGIPVMGERWGAGVRWCCTEFKEKWWRHLPFNGWYSGKKARFLVVGVKRSDSVHRARRWRDGMVNIYQTLGGVDVALAPLADLEDRHVWSLLRHYGIYNVIRPQYDVFGHSPNCMLCPFLSRRAVEKTALALPCPALRRLAGYYMEAPTSGPVSEKIKQLFVRVLGEAYRSRCSPARVTDNGGLLGRGGSKRVDRVRLPENTGLPVEPRRETLQGDS